MNLLMYMNDLKLHAKNEKYLRALVETVWIFTNDIKVEFGFDECARPVII